MYRIMSEHVPSCRCGHTRGHHLVSPEPVHSTLGWVGMFFGVSAKTIRVNYRCRRCEQVFDETTDPSVLRLVY